MCFHAEADISKTLRLTSKQQRYKSEEKLIFWLFVWIVHLTLFEPIGTLVSSSVVPLTRPPCQWDYFAVLSHVNIYTINGHAHTMKPQRKLRNVPHLMLCFMYNQVQCFSVRLCGLLLFLLLKAISLLCGWFSSSCNCAKWSNNDTRLHVSAL